MSPTESAPRAPEFPEDVEWLNVERPLMLENLAGKLVLLEFWTSC
ncbi:MAG: hypothetical protein ACKVXR_09150 [Planctomycetota bacterium]